MRPALHWSIPKGHATLGIRTRRTLGNRRPRGRFYLMKIRNAAWSVFGIGAVAVSVYILYREFRRISFAEVADSLAAITAGNWALAICATLVAYGALAWYDRIA